MEAYRQDEADRAAGKGSETDKPTFDEAYKQENTSGSINESRVDSAEFGNDLNATTSRPTGDDGMYTYEKKEKVQKYVENVEQDRFGTPSMFNQYSLFVHPRSDQNNGVDMMFNGDDNVFPKDERNITVQKILKDHSPNAALSNPYFASDFLYGKYYKQAPLNRMVTLRRFPYPTYDNLEFSAPDDSREFRPIAQAVTYFGEPTGNNLSSILKVMGNINWQEITADVHDVEGNEKKFSDSPLETSNSTLNTGLKFLNGGNNDLSGRNQQEIDAARNFGNIDYTNKTLGPVNVINKTNVRARGIGAEMDMSIVFEYKLRSYRNVNSRLAMLDLIFNMLSLTFNNAKFWGGANRYFPGSPQFGFFGDQDAYYRGDYGSYVGSVVDGFKTGFGNIGDALSGLISGIMGGDLSSLANIVKGAGATWLDLKSKKSRPQVLGFKSLLSGLPTGEWHLTVGNPYRPIAMIGNLICTGFEMELGDELGVDDFPTDVKFTVNLKSGRPRDKGDIESMLLEGQGRGYYPPDGVLDVGNLSSSTSNDGNVTDSGFDNVNQSNPRSNKDIMKKVAGAAF